MTRTLATLGILATAVSLTACSASKSSTPLSPSIAGAIPGIEISSPKMLEPTAGIKISVEKQPVTLLIENAGSNGSRPLSYSFDIATDTAFSSIVFSRDGVTQGDGGRTSLRLGDALATGHTYYWRARAQDGANTGPYSAPTAFQVVQPITINAPALIGPVGGAAVTENPPQLRIKNSSHSGPVGAIAYQVQVSLNDTFTALKYEELAPEQSGETHVTPSSPLPGSAKFYWRA